MANSPIFEEPPSRLMKSYLRLFRFRYHLNYISVVAGALFVSGGVTAAYYLLFVGFGC